MGTATQEQVNYEKAAMFSAIARFFNTATEVINTLGEKLKEKM